MNVHDILNSSRCTKCATCVGICPEDAIRIFRMDMGSFAFQIDKNKCKNCGLCLESCPRYKMDFSRKKLFDSDSHAHSIPMNKDNFLGEYVHTYAGHATNPMIRRAAASGGVISALLVFALEQGIIEGVVVVKMDENNPLKPIAVLAESREEILDAAQSKYLPVPLNLLLKEIAIRENKFAVVGLPCHIEGLRRAEAHCKKLADKIVLRIGTFCLSNAPLATFYLLKRLRIPINEVNKLRYREGKWPGQVVIMVNDGSVKSVPLEDFGLLLSFFSPPYCRLCTDHTNELADISVGDAWLPEFSGEEGWSVIISRTHNGDYLLKKALENNIIRIYSLDSEKVKQSQGTALFYKKRISPALINLLNAFHVEAPISQSESFMEPHLFDYISALLLYFTAKVTNGKFFSEKISHKINSLWFARYIKFVEFLMSI